MKRKRGISAAAIITLLLTSISFQTQGQQSASESNKETTSAVSGGDVQLTTLLAQARRNRRGAFFPMPENWQTANSADARPLGFGPLNFLKENVGGMRSDLGRTNSQNVEVSWQVTGGRADATAQIRI